MSSETPRAGPQELFEFFAAFLAKEFGLSSDSIQPTLGIWELGLDSLGCQRLIRDLNVRFGIRIRAKELYSLRTLEQAVLLAAGRGQEGIAANIPSQALAATTLNGSSNQTSLSMSQFGIWFASSIKPGSAAFNIPLCFELGSLDVDLLKQCCALLIADQPSLAIRIREANGVPQLTFIDSDVAFEILAEDCSSESQLQRLQSLAAVPFDLKSSPPIRFYLAPLAPDRHLFLVVAHHIAFDGASRAIMIQFLRDTYAALRRGAKVERRNPIGFAHFVEWERAFLASDEAIGHRQFWRDKLAGAAPGVDWPSGIKARASSREEYFVVTRTLTLDSRTELHELCVQLEATLPTILLSLFKLLIYRYSGQSDVLVAVPTLGRPDSRFDTTIGSFVNVVPLRTGIDDSLDFGALVATIRSNIAEALDRANYPFAKIVGEWDAPRDLDRPPLIECAFEYLDWREQKGRASTADESTDARWTRVRGFHQLGEFPLVLEVLDDGLTTEIAFKFDGGRFDKMAIERMAAHLLGVLDQVQVSPSQKLGDVDLVTESERTQIVDHWNSTAAAFSFDDTLFERVVKKAVTQPEAPAVSTRTESLTYRELVDRSSRLACHLFERGLCSGDRVGICLERSTDLVVALLAVMKSGAVYVPLDPTCPAQRLAYMVSDSQSTLVICHESTRAVVRSAGVEESRTVELTVDWSKGLAPQGGEHTQWPVVRVAQPAYVMYTSGSTGTPKGVVITHRSLLNFLLGMQDLVQLWPTDKVLAITNYGFDISGLEFYLPLLTGGECLLCSATSVRDADELRREITERRPTWMQATPTTWTMLVENGWRNDEGIRVLCGGEALPESLKNKLVAMECEVWNLYGPTETTIWSSALRMTANRSVSIGRPIANTQMLVVDRFGALCPIGVPGELWIGGEGVALGYFGKPELTSERFALSPVDGSRMYRTGDLAAWSDDGTIDCLGRMDHQVKLRGFRVELGEIESCLNAYPSVSQSAVVVTREGETAQLIAYCEVRPIGEFGFDAMLADHVSRIREYLKTRLPEYMVPTRFVSVSHLPQTPNGKVDRKALTRRSEETITEAPANRTDRSPPAASSEREVLDLWRHLLNRNDLSPDVGFFDAGGDSILAVKVAQALRDAFRCDFAIADIFRYPTARLCAVHIDSLGGRGERGVDVQATTQSRRIVSVEGRQTAVTDDYDNAVAIIGISCRFPGARDHREFWRLLLRGQESIRTAESVDDSHDSKRPQRFVARQARLEDKDCFDAKFFEMSPRDAALLDPQARILLEESWRAVEDAGYDCGDLKNTSVFVSASTNSYQAVASGVPDGSSVGGGGTPYLSWLLAQAGTIPTLISHRLGFTGASLFVHSNCSSGLVGIHTAIQNLLLRESDYALVGAACTHIAADAGYVADGGMNFSPTGSIRAFDAKADGMVPGEGVAVILLKRAREAIADNDPIHAIIRSVGVNNDGDRKAGFYAPSVQGQAAAIETALRKARATPDSIGYIEAHGTGTLLGDPIELAALRSIYGGADQRSQSCGIGSVKSNIGHSDTAAGLAGLIKTALSLKAGVIPPTLNFEKPNPELKLEESPFFIASRLRSWPTLRLPRRAAVSSFGIGGTNSHAILEQFLEPQDRAASEGPPTATVVPLSAKSVDSLRDFAVSLRKFLVEAEQRGALPALCDIAFTLQVGRRALPVRATLVVKSVGELMTALQAFSSGEALDHAIRNDGQAPDDGFGLLNSTEADSLVKGWFASGDLDKIGRAWTRGLRFDWKILHSASARRISLPGYVFARERHWLQRSQTVVPLTSNSIEVGTSGAVVDVCESVGVPLSTSLRERMRSLFAEVTEYDAAKISFDESFENYGIDSIAIIQLNEKLKAPFAELSKTLFFEYPNLGELCDYLLDHHQNECERWLGASRDRPRLGDKFVTTSHPVSADRVESSQPADDCIAIVGLAGKYPGADNIDAFWENLAAGRDMITDVPADRWSLQGFFESDVEKAIEEGKSYSKWGGFLDGFADFDPLFFNISPREALAMNPQERLFLQTAAAALEDAGCTKASLQHKYQGNVGVYAGVTKLGHELHGPALWAKGERLIPETNFASIANRVSYWLDVHGPSMPIDTMCSSSLTAIHEACEHLIRGECELAIAGGVNLYLHPANYVELCAQRMLSTDGRCKSFGLGGNGFVPGEGVGVVVLKPLRRAIADRDRIWGVIRATAVNHGGKTHGYTVPNPKAQRDVIAKALRKGKVNARHISYVEAHGTGTALGDPIEVTGLTQAFAAHTTDVNFCSLGSVKSNIGHLEAAAGIAGLTKVLLQLRHRRLAPSLHAAELNSNIDFGKTPFIVQRSAEMWRRPSLATHSTQVEAPRIAAVSSFGAGGANAHVIVEEYSEPVPIGAQQSARLSPRPALVVLSARTESQLRTRALELHAHVLSAGYSDRDLLSIAYTLQLGRDEHDLRLAFLAETIAELKAKLSASLKSFEGGENLKSVEFFRGDARTSKEFASALNADAENQRRALNWVRHGQYAQLLKRWVEGFLFDWSLLFGTEGIYKTGDMRLVSLPTYPFARNRYWIGDRGTPIESDSIAEHPITGDQTESASSVASSARKPGGEIVEDSVELLTPRWTVSTELTSLPEQWEQRWGFLAPTYRESRAVLQRLNGDSHLEILCESMGRVEVEAVEQRDADRALAIGLQIFARVQAILKSRPKGCALVQIVLPLDGVHQAVARAIAGLLKTAHEENPKVNGQVISFAATTGADEIAQALLQNACEEFRGVQDIRYVQGVREVLDFKTVSSIDSANTQSGMPPPLWKDGGVYLITGGAGGLGMILAAEVTRQAKGARVIVTGRSQLDGIRSAAVEGLTVNGARVEYRTLDVSDANAVRMCVHSLVEQHGQLNGIVHCAGIIEDGFIIKKKPEEFARVVAPKINGLINLDNATSQLPLDWLIAFASTSGTHGSTGQIDYSYANAFMDGFIAHRTELVAQGRRQGRSLSIDWPLWANGGMRVDRATEEAMRAEGFVPLPTEKGLEALYRAWRLGRGQVIVLSRVRVSTNASAPANPAPDVAAINGGASDRSLESMIVRLMAATIELPAAQIDPSIEFSDYGFDSISLTALGNRINRELGIKVSVANYFAHSTAASLGQYLAEEFSQLLDGRDSTTAPVLSVDSAATAAFSTEARTESTEPSKGELPNADLVAIIGIQGRFPGADNLDELWKNLCAGADAITEVPPARWSLDDFYEPDPEKASAGGKSYCKWGGFVEGVEEFDPLFFNIAPKDAQEMEAAERLLLEAVWTLFEEVGYTRETLREIYARKVGVYVAGSVEAANRTSYFFGLEGPSVAINTMCSSASMAIHSACGDLKLGHCELAIVGAANVLDDPEKFIRLSRLRLLAADARQRSFGGGLGYLPAEAVGAILLKPLARAIADGDTIHAVIRSTASNHDGRTNGYYVPNPSAQAALIETCIRRAAIDPTTIGYIEAGAAGAALPDAMELSAIKGAFDRLAPHRDYGAVGTVKAGLGHAEEASGIVQIASVVLQLRHGERIPVVAPLPFNPELDFASARLAVGAERKEWRRPRSGADTAQEIPRRALINSHGAGGSNVCILLEEYLPVTPVPKTSATTGEPAIVVVSAQTRTALAASATRLMQYVEAHPSREVASIAHALQHGREAMEWRLALVVKDRDSLVKGLGAFVESGTHSGKPDAPCPTFVGSASGSDLSELSRGVVGAAIMDIVMANRDLQKLALLWTQGARIAWEKVSGEKNVERIALPTYPFERQSFASRHFGLREIREHRVIAAAPLSTREMSDGSTVRIRQIEEFIASFLSDALSVPRERLDKAKDLQDYGVDSIVRVQLLRALGEEHGLLVSVREALRYRTIRALANYVSTRPKEVTVVAQSTDPLLDDNRAPLSAGQKGLWVVQKAYPELCAYNIPLCFKLRGAVDVDALNGALAVALRRHPVLEMTFESEHGRPYMRRLETQRPLISVQRAANLSDEELVALLKREAKRPFAMEDELLFRATLVTTADCHFLLLVVHHIVIDGRSVPLLLETLFKAYGNLVAGESVEAMPIPAVFADFAKWESEWLKTDAARRHSEYWKQKLAWPLPFTVLRGDRARNWRDLFEGATYSRHADRSLVALAKSFCHEHRLTAAVLFLSAFKSLINRYTGETDLLVGIPAVTRPHKRFDEVVGYFVNMLPLRTEVCADMTFADLLQRIESTVADALDHAIYPVASIMQDLQVASIRQDPGLLRIAFEFQNASNRGEQSFANLAPCLSSIEWFDEVRQEGEYELVLEIVESADSLELNFKYNPDHYDRSTIVRLMDHYVTLLTGAMNAPNEMIGRLPLTTQAEQVQLIESFGSRDRALQDDDVLHRLFETQVAKTPHAEAIVFERERLTYAELNRRANRLARYLRFRGVLAGDLVLLSIERGIDLVVAVVGILKAGAAYVPAPPELPLERIASMIEDAAPRAVVTQSTSMAKFVDFAGTVVAVDGDRERVDKQSEADLDALVIGLTPAHPAYVIYTSGSTGEPKGAVIEHRNVSRLFSATSEHFAFKQSDVWTLFHSIAFDFSVWEIWGPLSTGGRLVVVSDEIIKSPTLFDRLLREEKVTVLNQTPSAFGQLIPSMIASDKTSGDHALRVVIFGGEALPIRMLNPWIDYFGDGRTELVNMYGITEITVHATCHRLTREEIVQGESTSIGRPLKDLGIYVLDSYGQPVPIGVNGELYVTGAGVARGYLNRPELTAQRFVADPFASDAKNRMYKTGDVGRWRADGTIEYVGRNDGQVKVRGYRIELGEIENQLRRHGDVTDAIVMMRDEAEEKRLVAYVTLRDDGAVTSEALRHHLRGRLPEYMLPAAYVQLDALPLTINGKIDRRALPAPGLEAYAMREYEAPNGEIEEALAGIWQELLKVARVGRHDNFFELGGHSLLAVQGISRIRQVLGRELALRKFFELPTLIGQARELSALHVSAMSRIERADRGAALPLSMAQQRLWFIERLGGVGAAYHMPIAIRLCGRLNESVLQRALDRVVERHEVLRTNLVPLEGQAVQVIAKDRLLELRTTDLRTLTGAALEASIQAELRAEASAAFDLSQGSLIRARLLRLSTDDQLLAITLHHIVFDGWSMGVLFKELSVLYSAYLEERSDPLPRIAIQYADYAVWQRALLHGEGFKEQLDYWSTHLKNAPTLIELPSDRPRPVTQSYQGGAVGFELDQDLVMELKTLSRRHDATLFMTLYAGFALLLAKLSGQRDLVIGVPVANRQRTEFEGLIGLFVNTLPLRIRWQDDLSFAGLLEEVRRLTLEAYSRQEVPFEKMVEAIQPPRSLSCNPIFQVLFGLQNAPMDAPKFAGLDVAPQSHSLDVARLDLSWSIQSVDDRIRGFVEYSSDLFDRSTIARWVEQWKAILAAVVRDPTARVGVLSALSGSERRLLIEEFNGTREWYPDVAVHELFESRVEVSPDAVAVVFEEASIAYAELNRRANQVAHYLRRQGVGPDSLVCVCMERSVELLIALFGILKAGGAYVPLDPEYPEERLRFMLADANPRVVLTQEKWRSVLSMENRLTVALDGEWSKVAGESEANLSAAELGLTPRHLAYVIYTSGSTGAPKGVMVEHRSLVNYSLWKNRFYAARTTDAALQKAPIGFDMSVSELVTSLLAGARVVVARPGAQRDVNYLREIVEAKAVTTVAFVPSMLKGVLADWPRFDSLRHMGCGGEVLSPELAEEFHSRAGEHCRLFNLYGPTETTILVAHYECYASTERSSTSVPIGKPISNVRFYVMDAEDRLAPIGVAGELCVAGACVARGYWNQPALTRERFVRDPFSEAVDERMYRTGDLVRWLPDGNLEFIGRKDDQVKIRGHRIELGEIESHLRRIDGVRDAVVSAIEQGDEKRLVAYIVPAPEATLPNDTLRNELKGRLPEYMVPSAYVRIEGIPLTANGKVDRQALPAPGADAYLVREYEAPRGEIETALAEIWQALLGVDRIGRRDNFFELGGHSLLAIQLIHVVARRINITLELRTIFDCQTLDKLAAQIGLSGTQSALIANSSIPSARRQRVTL